MARIGSGVRPELGLVDFSQGQQGAMQGAAFLGQGVANLGKGAGDFMGAIREEKKGIKEAGAKLDAAEKMFADNPEAIRYINDARFQLETGSLRDASGVARGVSESISFMGQQMQRKDALAQQAFTNELATAQEERAKELHPFAMKKAQLANRSTGQGLRQSEEAHGLAMNQAASARWVQENTRYDPKTKRIIIPSAPAVGPGGKIQLPQNQLGPVGAPPVERYIPLHDGVSKADSLKMAEHVANEPFARFAKQDVRKLEGIQGKLAKLRQDFKSQGRRASADLIAKLEIPWTQGGENPFEGFSNMALTPLEQELGAVAMELAQIAARQRNPKGTVTDKDFEATRKSLISIAKNSGVSITLLDPLINKIEREGMLWDSKQQIEVVGSGSG